MTVRVLIEPVTLPGLTAAELAELAAAHPEAAAHLGAPQAARLMAADVRGLGHDPGKDAAFTATVYDPDSNRAVELSGRLDSFPTLQVRPSNRRPTPRGEELAQAAAILRADARFPAADDIVIYQPMPPTADLERPDGSSVRRPTLGIYNPAGGPRHHIVAVDVAEGTVDWAPEGVAEPTDQDCEHHLPEGVGPLANQGGPNQVRVRVMDGDTELWNLIVVRPRNSQPAGDASGLELLNVRHRGRLVLRQAHMPVLNVLYAMGTTFRDWMWEETRFSARGTDPVGKGWRLCDKDPLTILERSDNDAGNFQGVAFFHDGEELRIVSEIQAGWYRYVSEYRLADDGTIKPRMGFAGTKDPMTCMRHNHHAYWRFDFDIEGAANDVVEQVNDSGGIIPDSVPIKRETSRRRKAPAKAWDVLDKATRHGYRIVPGPHDGTADSFGVSDLWFLRHHPGELHEGGTMGDRRDTMAHLNKFLNDEDIDGANLVVWYAGHFMHDELAPEPHQGHLVGPDLVPLSD
ncbi:hypothetical protein ACIBG8_06665 [Nonomuraea sp. NPDC050556]|uniref:hypothetical protein n=1 Tax=Nonomuraea sp. NPDC050556 TaxID=3364369 RepID=UPI0037A9124C